MAEFIKYCRMFFGIEVRGLNVTTRYLIVNDAPLAFSGWGICKEPVEQDIRELETCGATSARSIDDRCVIYTFAFINGEYEPEVVT